MLPANFFFQKARLDLGLVACRGQPCQKQPSTKSARRAERKTKSGRTEKILAGRRCRAGLKFGPRSSTALPGIWTCLRQPVIWLARNSLASTSSVSLLPRERMRDIKAERFALVKTSGMTSN